MAQPLNLHNLNDVASHANSSARIIAELSFANQPYCVELIQSESNARIEVEQFIHDVYANRYHADVQMFMPNLIAIRHIETKELIAAAGFRMASRDRLFLEEYLDFPVEKAASAVTGNIFQRERFVEVGNLAGAMKGAGYLVILTLADYLTSNGFNWIAFTLTERMVTAFTSLGLTPIALIDANEERIGGASSGWGEYYKTRPQAMIGEMGSACQKMHKMGMYRSILYQAHYANTNHANTSHANTNQQESAS